MKKTRGLALLCAPALSVLLLCECVRYQNMRATLSTTSLSVGWV